MNFYWSLQWLRIKRILQEIGVVPYLAIPFFVILFFVVIKLLYVKSIYAPYILIFLLISTLSPLSQKRRNSFIKINFGQHDFLKIRLIENLTIAISFALVMTINKWHLVNILPLIIGVLMVLTNTSKQKNTTMPTPFTKRPFEFIVGLRTTWIILLVQFLVFIIGLKVNNYNLSAVLYLSFYLTFYTFYNKMEEPYFLWLNTISPTNFLNNKIKMSFIQTTKLVLFPFILLITLQPVYWKVTLLLTILGFLYVCFAAIVKYANYPKLLKITTIIIVVASITLPFLLCLTIPFYYRKALANLKIELI